MSLEILLICRVLCHVAVHKCTTRWFLHHLNSGAWILDNKSAVAFVVFQVSRIFRFSAWSNCKKFFAFVIMYFMNIIEVQHTREVFVTFLRILLCITCRLMRWSHERPCIDSAFIAPLSDWILEIKSDSVLAFVIFKVSRIFRFSAWINCHESFVLFSSSFHHYVVHEHN